MKILLRLLPILALSAVCAFAQPTKSIPAPSNVPGAEFPRLDSEGRGTFQIKAPDAHSVQVNLPQGTFELAKEDSDDGIWSVTTEPLEPGFHYYAFRVDGAMVFDPGSRAFYGASRHGSGIEVPEPGIDFYDLKDVPHGQFRSLRYHSPVTNSWRQLIVYTPPGYDATNDTRYPTLYLQHGGGEDETSWAQQGKTDLILDNLIAAGKALPMLVVIANGNLPRPPDAPPGYSRPGMAPFATEMLTAIIPTIDSQFRTIADPQHRALAGLSMGGGQAFIVGLAHPETFASIGSFSTGLFGGIRETGPFDVNDYVPGLLDDVAAANAKLDLFYLSCGEQDNRIGHTKTVVEQLRAEGLDVAFSSFSGGHEWQVWRKSLHDFVPRLFKN